MTEFAPHFSSWFPLLSPEHQKRVQQDIKVHQYPPGAMIVRKGESSDHWIGVVEGLIRISVGNADGKVAALIGIPSGGWVGEGSLLKKEQRKYDIITLRTSTIAKMPVHTFEWLLDNSIPFNRYLLHLLNERVGHFVGKAEHDRLLNADARIARCLAELCNSRLYPGISNRMEITQEELGYLARVSRQRANQALKKLEADGLLSVEYGAICVQDLAGLENFGN